MKLDAYLIAVLVCAALAGCMAATSPSRLSVPTIKETLTVKPGLIYRVPETKISAGLREGSYVAEFEDQTGTYFRGPPHCFFTQNEADPENLDVFEGGIWVPKEGVQVSPRIYYYVGSNTVERRSSGVDALAQQQVERAPPQAGVAAGVGAAAGMGVVSALASLDYGKIMFGPQAPANADLAAYVQKAK